MYCRPTPDPILLVANFSVMFTRPSAKFLYLQCSAGLVAYNGFIRALSHRLKQTPMREVMGFSARKPK